MRKPRICAKILKGAVIYARTHLGIPVELSRSAKGWDVYVTVNGGGRLWEGLTNRQAYDIIDGIEAGVEAAIDSTLIER